MKSEILNQSLKYSIDTAMLQSYQDSDFMKPFRVMKPLTNANGELDIIAIDANNLLNWIKPNPEMDSGWEIVKSEIEANLIAVGPSIDEKRQCAFAACNIPGTNRTKIFEVVCEEHNINTKPVCEVERGCDNSDELKCGITEFNDCLTHFLILSGGFGKWSPIVNTLTGEWYFTVPNLNKQYLPSMRGSIMPFAIGSNGSAGVWPNIRMVGSVTTPVAADISAFFYTEPLGTRTEIDGHQALYYDYSFVDEGNMFGAFSLYTLVKDANQDINFYGISEVGDLIHARWTGEKWLKLKGGYPIEQGTPADQLTNFSARLKMDGQIEFTVLSKRTNRLLLCTQTHDSDWTSWLPIAKDCTTIGMGQFKNGFTQIFDDAADNSLRIFYQDETRSQSSHDWTEELVMLEGENSKIDDKAPLLTGKSYRTCVTAFDEQQAPVKGARCLISVSDFLPCYVNGKFRELQPEFPVAFETNVMGQINIEYILESSLYSPSFSVSPEEGQYAFSCTPDRDTQAFLKDLTAEQLAWKSKDGTSVLPSSKDSPENREQVANAIREAAGHLNQIYAPYTGNVSLFTKNVDLHGVRVIEKREKPSFFKYDHQLVERKPSQLKFVNGHPVFSYLTESAFDSILRDNTNARNAFPGTFGGIFDFFGDVWECIKNVAGEVVSFVWDGIKAAVEFIVDGIVYVFDQVINSARDLFDLVAAFLDELGALLGTVLLWVLELLDFLFDWDKIIQTKDRIKTGIKEALTQFHGYLGKERTEIEPKIRNWIKQLPGAVKDDAEAIARSPLGTQNSKQFEVNIRESFFTIGDHSFWNSGTWLLNTVLDKVISRIIPSFRDSELLDSFQKSLESLEEIFQGDGIPEFKEFWDKIKSAFQTLLNDPLAVLSYSFDQLMQLFQSILSSLLQLLEIALQKGVDLIFKLTDIFLSFISWLDEEIYIPFVSSFYRTVIKGPLSFLDLCSLIIAVPFHAVESFISDASQELEKDWKSLVASFAFLAGEITNILASGVGSNFVLTILTDIFSLIAGGFLLAVSSSEAVEFPTAVLLTAASGVHLLAYIIISKFKNKEYPELAADILLDLAGVVNIYTSTYSLKSGDKKSVLQGSAGVLYGIRNIFSLACLIDSKTSKGQNKCDKPVYLLSTVVLSSAASGCYFASSGYS